jgi:hypothetical protein
MTTPAPSSPTPFVAISQFLAWAAKRAAPLTALTIAIAAMLWSDFRHEFGLPIGFASGSVLAALPALAAIVSTAIGCLALGLATPAQVLTMPIRPDGPTMASLLKTPIDPVTRKRSNQRISHTVERYWIGMAAISGMGWVGVIAWVTLCPDTPIGAGLLLMLAVVMIQTACASPMLRRALGESSPANAGFYLILLLSHVMQSYLSFAVMYVLLKTSTSTAAWDLTVRIAGLLVIMVAVAVLQLIVSMRIIKGWYPNLIKHVVCLAFAIMGAISIIPPLGARLASFALLSTASPNRPCSILLFNAGSKEMPPKPIVDEHTPSQSKELRIVFPFDNAFYVKESTDTPSYIVDAKALAGTKACPAEASSDSNGRAN